jgi:phenylacetate-CoA ligase
MEINSETLFVEILDDKGAVLPYGKRRIVITSYSTKPIRLFVMILAILILDEKALYKDHFAAINGRTNIAVVLPSGKSAWFNTTLQKHYRGRWKCKEFTIKIDTFFIIKYVSDIILSQSQIKK